MMVTPQDRRTAAIDLALCEWLRNEKVRRLKASNTTAATMIGSIRFASDFGRRPVNESMSHRTSGTVKIMTSHHIKLRDRNNVPPASAAAATSKDAVDQNAMAIILCRLTFAFCRAVCAA